MSSSYYSSFQYWCGFPSVTSIFMWGRLLKSWSYHNILLGLHMCQLSTKCSADDDAVSVMAIWAWQSWLQRMYVKTLYPDANVLLSLIRDPFTSVASLRFYSRHSNLQCKISSLMDRWLVLPTYRCPCPSPTCHFSRRPWREDEVVLLTGAPFPIKKDLRNPLNRRLLFPVICRRDDTRMSSPERRLGQRFIWNRRLPM